MTIKTGNSIFRGLNDRGEPYNREDFVKDLRSALHLPPISVDLLTAAVEPRVRAIVNHGRWIVRCPFCSGAEFIWEGKPFICLSCFNGGGKSLKIIMPRNRKAIEQALASRPVGNQNWEPGETVEFLLQENETNGVS